MRSAAPLMAEALELAMKVTASPISDGSITRWIKEVRRISYMNFRSAPASERSGKNIADELGDTFGLGRTWRTAFTVTFVPFVRSARQGRWAVASLWSRGSFCKLFQRRFLPIAAFEPKDQAIVLAENRPPGWPESEAFVEPMRRVVACKRIDEDRGHRRI